MYDEDSGTAVLGVSMLAATGVSVGWIVVGVLVSLTLGVFLLRLSART